MPRRNSPNQTMDRTAPWKGIACAGAAAALFGASTPLAKLLLPGVEPVMMAGLLYLGSGLGLAAWQWICRRRPRSSAEAKLQRQDIPSLVGAILSGGVIAPVLLLLGLSYTPASTASLLLNLEGVLTAVLAWFVFKENFDQRIAFGMILISAGAGALSWFGRPILGPSWGSLAISGACLAWAMDNNLTRKVSAADPVQIAMLKGLCAGAVNTGIALTLGARIPPMLTLAAIGLIGLLGYGMSLVLFILALRNLGTARTGAYFALAPFIGATVSVALLHEPVTSGLLVAAVLMGAGVWLHLTEHHDHDHGHSLIEHEHLHTHDEHHQHTHSLNDPEGEPHSHRHRHEDLVHRHPHYPDIHHRHGH